MEMKNLIDEVIHTIKYTQLDSHKLFLLTQDLYNLCIAYIEEDTNDACVYIIKYLIPLLKNANTRDKNEERMIKYYQMLKNSYGYAARRSLEHFILYYEWDWDMGDKLLENRYDILIPYVYYLNKMAFDPNLEYVICAYPSGWGKSRVMKYYEAWRLGVDSGGTFLALCSNDDLVKSLSRSVIDIIKTDEYKFVFPHLNYQDGKKLFVKETDGEWRLSTCKLASSYIAKSRDANIVGVRASLSIDIDDMYADSNEALDLELHKRLWNKFITVILARFIRNKKAQVVMSGTMWSPYDLVCQVIAWLKNKIEFMADPKFKYTEVATDGRAVIIRVPALDFETDESTCPNIESTEKLRDIRASISQYLWQCNFQQNPVPPDGLDFDWKVLSLYELPPTPDKDYKYTLASLDPARAGKNFVSMPIFTPIDDKYVLVDVLFKKASMLDLYDDIVGKIIDNNVIRFVIENNIDTSLKKVISDKLIERGYYNCEIIEKYNLGKKENRIRDYQGIIRNRISFPDKNLHSVNTPMGRFMEQLTTFSFNYPNKYDDAIDSVALFAGEIIEDRASRNKASAINRRKLGI